MAALEGSAPSPAGVSNVPTTMKAAVYTHKGGSDVLHVQQDFPIPPKKANELLVKVAASSVNPIDFKIRKTGLPPGLRSIYPKVTGSDGSGVVVEVGHNGKFKPGDQVFFYLPLLSKFGAAAEYTTVPEDHACLVPAQHIDLFSAAALPLVACTAWQALQKSMPLNGKSVFVQGGSGGVGTTAIQIAKSQGAFIVTTCSRESSDLCKQLGADHTIDYRTQRFEEASKDLVPEGFDLVVSQVDGWDYDKRNLALVKKGGHFTYIFRLVTTPSEWLVALYTKMLRLTGRLGACTVLVARGRHDLGLDQVAGLIREGKLRAVIAKMYPSIDHIAEAQDEVERGSGVKGKIVVKSVQNMEALLQGGLLPFS